ncbi:MAG: hypothetical protein U0796_02330 [Gemmatales bacterium]
MDSTAKLKSLLRSGKWSYAEILIDEELKKANNAQDRSRWMAHLGVLRSLGDHPESMSTFQEALQLDSGNDVARWNYELLAADRFGVAGQAPLPSKKTRARIAVLSFLFNWPSTGGGIVHTVELCDFLNRAGYEVEHYYARYDPWELGVVKQQTPMISHELRFNATHWNLRDIQQRYREAVDDFQPDYVIVTDSWNMKPVLAEAVEKYPFI